MANYIDAFIFPIAIEHLNEYKQIAAQVAGIWKEHGALAYKEFVGDDLEVEGLRSFLGSTGAKAGETVLIGWTEFDSREARDLANEQVPKDPRMRDLVAPLMDPSRMIFDAERMIFGGFKSLVH